MKISFSNLRFDLWGRHPVCPALRERHPAARKTGHGCPVNRQAGSLTHIFRPALGGVLLVILLFAGCATEVGQHTFLKQSYPAKPANHPIDVYTNGLPTRPFERVAFLDAHCESQYWATPNLEKDALPELKKQARAAGCDGIIEIEERKPKNWTLETRTIHVTATGIVYK